MPQDTPILEYQSPAKRYRPGLSWWIAGLLVIVSMAIYVLHNLELVEQRTNGNYDMSVFIGDEAAELVRPTLMTLCLVWCALVMALIGRIARRLAVGTRNNGPRRSDE